MAEVKKATAWFIFTIENNYDQPSNNLLWWSMTKPSMDELATAIYNRKLAECKDDLIIKIVGIWRGEHHRIDETEYRLVEIPVGHISND